MIGNSRILVISLIMAHKSFLKIIFIVAKKSYCQSDRRLKRKQKKGIPIKLMSLKTNLKRFVLWFGNANWHDY